MIITTQAMIEAAFCEWERRWREEPERFRDEAERATISPETYGEEVAPYFLRILEEQHQAAL